ncbi:hypothetical protein BT69DRAFT_249464 [Atractiella rhizophila]|nr:hypothetical protein BT69DRAFT_249464 [Atractiella rhizophila]
MSFQAHSRFNQDIRTMTAGKIHALERKLESMKERHPPSTSASTSTSTLVPAPAPTPNSKSNGEPVLSAVVPQPGQRMIHPLPKRPTPFIDTNTIPPRRPRTPPVIRTPVSDTDQPHSVPPLKRPAESDLMPETAVLLPSEAKTTQPEKEELESDKIEVHPGDVGAGLPDPNDKELHERTDDAGLRPPAKKKKKKKIILI